MQGHLLQKTNPTDQFLRPLINSKFSLLSKYCNKVHLDTRFAICTQRNIAQGDLHLWTKLAVMLQHLLFDDREHWRVDHPGVFIEQQSQGAKPRELRQMLMKH